MTSEDLVNYPPHYTSNSSGVETIELTENLSFNTGNALKYVSRYRLKNSPVQDIEKAIFYVKREIERLDTAHVGYYLSKSEHLEGEAEDRLFEWCLSEDNSLVVEVVQRLWYARFVIKPKMFLESALGYLEMLLEEVKGEE